MSIPQADELGRELAKLDRDDLERMVRGLLTNGVALSFHGKRTAMEIARGLSGFPCVGGRLIIRRPWL